MRANVLLDLVDELALARRDGHRCGRRRCCGQRACVRCCVRLRVERVAVRVMLLLLRLHVVLRSEDVHLLRWLRLHHNLLLLLLLFVLRCELLRAHQQPLCERERARALQHEQRRETCESDCADHVSRVCVCVCCLLLQ